MHPISDKELDKLFQQRFGDLEIEPSEAVWGKITGKMDRQKTGKRYFSRIWMAAASLIVVISAGLWFYRPVEVIKLQGHTEMAQVKADIPPLPETNEPLNEPEKDAAKRTEFTLANSAGIGSGEYKLSEESPVIEPISKSKVENEVNIIASIPVKKSNTPQPKQVVKIPARYSGDQSKLDVTQPDMMAKAELPPVEIGSAEPQKTEHKKIRSIGSLVNFVIARVDKRDDKIIEFKEGAEGSEVSGINLGLVKFKSRK